MEDAQLLSAYQRQIYALRSLIRQFLHNQEDVEDLLADTFVSAWQARHAADPQHIAAWLMAIARNRAIDICRRRALIAWQSIDVPNEDGMTFDAADPDDAYRSIEQQEEFQEKQRLLDVLIADMSPKDRLCVARRYLEGHSFADIATEIGGSVPSVKMRLHRARERLQQRYQRGVAQGA